jgi:hypothetical protein
MAFPSRRGEATRSSRWKNGEADMQTHLRAQSTNHISFVENGAKRRNPARKDRSGGGSWSIGAMHHRHEHQSAREARIHEMISHRRLLLLELRMPIKLHKTKRATRAQLRIAYFVKFKWQKRNIPQTDAGCGMPRVFACRDRTVRRPSPAARLLISPPAQPVKPVACRCGGRPGR